MTIEIVLNGEVLTSVESSTGAPAVREPMPIQRLAIVGASEMDQSFNSAESRTEMMALMANAGVPDLLSVNTTYSNDGDASGEYLAKLPNMISDASGFEGMMFIIHGFGNDITREGPWPGGADQYESVMREMITRLKDAGHMVAWSSVTYRPPGFSNPPAPYNARITVPVLEELTPDLVEDGVPFLDLYSMTYNHQSFIGPDGIHPTDRGRAAIRGYIARRVADLINPAQPSPIEDYLGKTVIFSVGGNLHQTFSDGINGFVANHETGTAIDATQGLGHCLQVYATDGTPLYGPTVWVEYGNVNTAGASSDSGQPDLLNALVVQDSVWANPSVDGRWRVQGLPNGLTGTMTAIAARDATDTRLGDYTYRGTTQTMDGAWQEGTEPATISWPFVVEDGYLQIDWSVSEGSEWAYLNGVGLVFDA